MPTHQSQTSSTIFDCPNGPPYPPVCKPPSLLAPLSPTRERSTANAAFTGSHYSRRTQPFTPYALKLVSFENPANTTLMPRCLTCPWPSPDSLPIREAQIAVMRISWYPNPMSIYVYCNCFCFVMSVSVSKPFRKTDHGRAPPKQKTIPLLLWFCYH